MFTIAVKLLRWIVLAALLLPFVLGGLIAADSMDKRWSPDLIARSMATGDVIIAELKRTHPERGEYPAMGEGVLSLVATEHRRPVAGEQRWVYTVSPDRQQVELSFKARGRAYNRRYARSEMGCTWEMDECIHLNAR